jgi:anti-sigma factor RsiW
MSVPSVFGLPHLSEDAVAAFADGVLSSSAAARAQRHCAECPECAEAVRGQREAAMMLRSAAAPSLPSGLLDRLAGVPQSAPLPPPRHGLPTVLGADGVPMFDTRPRRDEHESEDGQAHTSSHGLRRGTLPFGLLASAAAMVAAGTLGGHQAVAVPVRPSLQPLTAGAQSGRSSGQSGANSAFAGFSTVSIRTAGGTVQSPLTGAPDTSAP